MRIGIVFGCFIPLHSGHISLINRAMSENDIIIIGVCGKDSDRGKDFIPFRTRLKIMQQKYQSGHVKVVPIDDEKLKLDGTFTYSNWIRWGTELFQNANIDPLDTNIQFTWYTGEPSYKAKLGNIYPNHKIILIDRGINTISGTKIRNDVEMYKDEIDKDFLDYIRREKYEI